MEQLLLEDFLRYRFLSGLKAAPGGEDLAFLCAMADREENAELVSAGEFHLGN